MDIKLKLRIKPEHNPKEFTEGMGRGVLVVQEMSLDIPEKWSGSRTSLSIMNIEEQFMNTYCEVITEIIKNESL